MKKTNFFNNISIKKHHVIKGLVITSIVLISLLFIMGLKDVPFHPDESTQIYMSSDIETFITDPISVYWSVDKNDDKKQTYRTLDAPITRYVIGIGRKIAHLKPLPTDWDWSLSWEDNQKNGALPDQKLLFIARLSVVIFFPLTLLGIYECGKMITGSKFWGLITLLLFSSNALVLLHTRRAMSESLLLFSTVLFILAMLKIRNRYWLLSIPSALAFNTKQLSIPLFIAGLIIIFLQLLSRQSALRNWIKQFVLYLLLFFIITLLLNPFLWQHPCQSILASISNRQTLLQNQIEMFSTIYPTLLNAGPIKRAGIILINLFLSPPSISEVGNYLENTAFAANAYLSNFLHTLFRGMIWGSVMLLLSIFGFAIGMKKSLIQKKFYLHPLFLLAVISLIQFIFLSVLIRLPFQRYAIILIPFTCLWIVYTLKELINNILSYLKKTFQQKNATSN